MKSLVPLNTLIAPTTVRIININDLARDILSNGLRRPLDVVATDQGFCVLEGGGSRRWLAATMLGLTLVPVRCR